MKKFLDHFELSPEILQNVIAMAMSKGADYADLYFEHRISNSLGLEDGTVNRAYSNIEFGVGIRALKGDQTGFAYSETVETTAMLEAAKMAAAIANSPGVNMPLNISEHLPASFYNISEKWEDVAVEDKIPFVQRINDRVFELDEKVIKVNAFLNDETSYILFFNSEGKISYDYRPLVSFGVVSIMKKGSQVENNYSARSFRKGFEWLGPDLVEELARETVEKTNILFEAISPKAGEWPVVMGAGGSGILLHEAIGHAFEADFNRKGESIFSDMMGKKVAADFINIVDDGTLPGNRGSINIDDEGNQVEKTYLVRNGILNSYLHDRISSEYYRVSPTGNGRRESFRHIPLPRMRSTYMEPGSSTKDDLLSSIDYGVYVDNFSNGQVKIGAGDFTFYV